MQNRSSSLRRRLAVGLTIGLTALSIMITPAAAPQTVVAQSGGQNDPAWDYGRGGSEVPGQPACYTASLNETSRKEYSLARPACNQWKIS